MMWVSLGRDRGLVARFLGLLSLVIFGASAAHAELNPAVAVGAQHFAEDEFATTRADINAEWKSEAPLFSKSNLRQREFHFYSFFESGIDGDHSIDIDSAVMRFRLGSSYVWAGRTHPAAESVIGSTVSSTSAIGANWVQNQSNALEPRVSGWIGAGWSGTIPTGSSSFVFTVAASPLYLPSFGPRVELSELQDAQASRYGRLPPMYLNLNNQLLPLRFKINVGDITNIVLQNQFFASIGRSGPLGDFRLMAWSAPTPSPQVDTAGKLRINAETQADDRVNVLVTATPKFPRENFLALEWGLRDLRPFPVLDAAYETTTGRLALSAQAEPLSFVALGGLHTLQTRAEPVSEGPSVESPVYAERLVWVELGERAPVRVRPSLRVEQHLTSGKQGSWVRPMVEYFADKHFRIYAQANVIAGDDLSYFGAWRSLDSVAAGMRYQW